MATATAGRSGAAVERLFSEAFIAFNAESVDVAASVNRQPIPCPAARRSGVRQLTGVGSARGNLMRVVTLAEI